MPEPKRPDARPGRFARLKAWLADKFGWLRDYLQVALGITAGLFIALMLALILMGNAYDPARIAVSNLPFESRKWVELGDLARIGLVAGIAAILTRILSLAGVFRRAVRDVVAEEIGAKFETLEPKVRTVVEGVFLEDRASERPFDMDDLWRRVSQKVLLPGFVATNPKDNEFLGAVSDELVTLMKERQPYYVNDLDRLYVIELSGDGETLNIREESYYQVIPFDAGAVVPFETTYVAATGTQMSQYGIEHTRLLIDGENMLKKIEAASSSQRKAMRVELKGKKRYAVDEVIVVRQPLSADPLFICAPNYVCKWSRLRIQCSDPRLVVNFVEVRVKGAFRPFEAAAMDIAATETAATETAAADAAARVPTTAPAATAAGAAVRDEQLFHCGRTLLPDQGFVISMMRKPPAAA